MEYNTNSHTLCLLPSDDDIDIQWKINQLEIHLDRNLAYTALRKITTRRSDPPDPRIEKRALWCITLDTHKTPLRRVIPECALPGMVLVSTEEVRSDPEDYYAEVLTEWRSELVDEWFDILTDEAVIIVRKIRTRTKSRSSSKVVSAYVRFDCDVGPNDTEKITKAVQALRHFMSV